MKELKDVIKIVSDKNRKTLIKGKTCHHENVICKGYWPAGNSLIFVNDNCAEGAKEGYGVIIMTVPYLEKLLSQKRKEQMQKKRDAWIKRNKK